LWVYLDQGAFHAGDLQREAAKFVGVFRVLPRTMRVPGICKHENYQRLRRKLVARDDKIFFKKAYRILTWVLPNPPK
jgi:hypothetical protein